MSGSKLLPLCPCGSTTMIAGKEGLADAVCKECGKPFAGLPLTRTWVSQDSIDAARWGIKYQ